MTRELLAQRFRAGRARSRSLFEIPRPESYYDRPIALRNPIVFYEGHLPAFNVNTVLKGALKRKGINSDFERLFERGIDPEDEGGVKSPTDMWPSRQIVLEYGKAADRLIEETLLDQGAKIPTDYSLAIIEHEFMHQETLLYIFHNMDYDKKLAKKSDGSIANAQPGVSVPHEHDQIFIPGGNSTLGASREASFGWDNEFPAHTVEVAGFRIDRHNVTNGQYLEYVNATHAAPPHFWIRGDGEWFWRGMFELIPLPLSSPVYVTHDEADAYARWKGMRLPSESEYHRAAFGTPSGVERAFPWGDAPPGSQHGNFDFQHWDPVPVGSYPEGASAWGVHDLIGNGWEWTSTVFNGFAGFQPMRSYPVYSSDFFDGQHYVLKGASPATARDLVRRSFRNWFRPNYPYLYATFRCVA